jgi:hypothetical protein
MAALGKPQVRDIVIRRDASGAFTLAAGAGTPQVLSTTLAEALDRAAGFTRHRYVHVWCNSGGVTGTRLADVTLLRRIWSEYIEMPGLRLTREQARRLWTLDADTCDSLLESLVELQFLVRSLDGKYGRLTEGPERPRWLAARF